MQKFISANRFGLAISFVFLSLFTCSSAFAQKTAAAGSGPQQVVVTNTAAQPVPTTVQGGTVAVQEKELYQAYQVSSFGNTGATLNFAVPAGKKLVIEHITISLCVGSSSDSYVALANGDNYSFYSALDLHKGGFVGGLQWWDGQTNVRMIVSQNLQIYIGATAGGGNPRVFISGYLIPA